MNGYLLDTNVISEYGRTRPPDPRAWPVATSCVSVPLWRTQLTDESGSTPTVVR